MSQFSMNTVCYPKDNSIVARGQIFDAKTKETLPFANVYLSENSEIGTAANEQGEFVLEVPIGSTLTVSFTGYHPMEFVVKQDFTNVYLNTDDLLDTVYIEGNNKKKNNNWLWWLLVAGIIAKTASSSFEEKKTGLGQPIKAKI